MIYFIRGGDKYKIGYTRNEETLTSRVASLQTGNPYKLQVIATCEGSEQDEALIHAELQRTRTDGGTEWFDLTDEKTQSILLRMEKSEHFDSRPIDGATAFDVRPLRRRQQHEATTARNDVLGQRTTFDHSGDKSLFNALRRKYQVSMSAILRKGR